MLRDMAALYKFLATMETREVHFPLVMITFTLGLMSSSRRRIGRTAASSTCDSRVPAVAVIMFVVEVHRSGISHAPLSFFFFFSRAFVD
jgi:hypothetical protein